MKGCSDSKYPTDKIGNTKVNSTLFLRYSENNLLNDDQHQQILTI
jgi:hypothetical protein